MVCSLPHFTMDASGTHLIAQRCAGDGDEEVKIPVVCVTKTAGRVFSTSAAVTGLSMIALRDDRCHTRLTCRMVPLVDLVYTEADAPQLNDDDDASSIGRPDGSEVSSRSSSSSGSDSDSASGSDSRDASTRGETRYLVADPVPAAASCLRGFTYMGVGSCTVCRHR